MIPAEIKNLEVLNLHAKLVPIAEEAMTEYGLEIITSAYRPGTEGVHGQMPVRGIDFRCRDVSDGLDIERSINSEWEYDPDRPLMNVCVAHGEGENFHIHLQVHKNTRRRV